jgi:hypothetical protein
MRPAARSQGDTGREGDPLTVRIITPTLIRGYLSRFLLPKAPTALPQTPIGVFDSPDPPPFLFRITPSPAGGKWEGREDQ